MIEPNHQPILTPDLPTLSDPLVAVATGRSCDLFPNPKYSLPYHLQCPFQQRKQEVLWNRRGKWNPLINSSFHTRCPANVEKDRSPLAAYRGIRDSIMPVPFCVRETNILYEVLTRWFPTRPNIVCCRLSVFSVRKESCFSRASLSYGVKVTDVQQTASISCMHVLASRFTSSICWISSLIVIEWRDSNVMAWEYFWTNSVILTWNGPNDASTNSSCLLASSFWEDGFLPPDPSLDLTFELAPCLPLIASKTWTHSFHLQLMAEDCDLLSRLPPFSMLIWYCMCML